MSKLGKIPIEIPKNVTVKVDKGKLSFSGPKGSKEVEINEKLLSAEVTKDNFLKITPIKKNELTNRIWGVTRSIMSNTVQGIGVGYEKILEMTGVGYRAAIKNNELNLQIGFSHDVNYQIPNGIEIKVEKQTTIKINGNDKSQVGRVASEIKSFRPVEPYKGKGIKEKGQYVLRKEGKKK